MPSQIRLNNIAYAFNNLDLFSEVNFSVSCGQVVVIMGRSGSGKSTLLEISAGLKEPLSGKVLWGGRDIRDLSVSELTAERRKVGFVFQHHALISNLTVFDNIALPLRYHSSMPDKTLQVMVNQHLDKFKIGELCDTLPEALSVGQARLVSIARALIMRPELLFLDEPVGGLDPVIARKIIAILLQLRNRSNLTIVMVSHIINFIEKLRCPIVFLNNKTATYYENIHSFRKEKEGIEFTVSIDGVV